MLPYVLGFIIFVLLVLLGVGYWKYTEKDKGECPTCNSSTCPAAQDNTSICDITSGRITDNAAMLAGLTLADVTSSASTELQDAMYTFCDDAYIMKTLCPAGFTSIAPMYNTLCSVPTSEGFSSQGRFRAVVQPSGTGATATGGANGGAGGATGGATKDKAKDKADRDANKNKHKSLCKIKNNLSPCVCATGETRGVKHWNTTYENKLGTTCTPTEEVTAKMNCGAQPDIPCSCAATSGTSA